MWAKVIFLWIAYALTFAITLVHAVLQRRRYLWGNAVTKSMGDYAAICTGLPNFSGSDSWEDKLRAYFEKETGLQLVGVSICAGS